MARPQDQNAPRKRPPWIFLAIGAGILVVAAMIFSAAGPDRSRTELKDTSPYAVTPRGGGGSESKLPNVNMPTAPQTR